MKNTIIVVLIFLVGLGWHMANKEKKKLRDYQLLLHMDTVVIFDNEREVGRFITDYSSKYDSIIMRDNE